MKKLWRVKVETQMVVLAEDEREAMKEVLADYAKSEINLNSKRIVSIIGQVRHIGSVPNGWLDRIPYGKRLHRLLKEKTVREIIERKLFHDMRRHGEKVADNQSACKEWAQEEKA